MKRAFATATVLLVMISGLVGAADEKRITRAEAMSSASTKVQPDYPPAARQLRVEGSVEIEAVISETGAVEKVNIVTGNPILTRAAADAVRRWKFQPILSEGKPVRAIAPLLFTFKL